MRRYGIPAERGRRYTLRPGVYAILPRWDDVLLTFQQAPMPEVQLPGGGIDPGESPVAALYREVFEETGWRIGAPVKLGAYRRFTYMPEYDLYAEKVCHIYIARPIRRHGPPREAGHTALWMPRAQAVDYLANEGDADFARAALLGTAP